MYKGVPAQSFIKSYSKNANQFVSIFSATDSLRRSSILGLFFVSINFSISSASNVNSMLKRNENGLVLNVNSNLNLEKECITIMLYYSFLSK